MCPLVAATSRGLPIPMRLGADYYPTRACTFRASPAHAFYPLSTAGGEILSIASPYRTKVRARFPAVWSHSSTASQTSFNRPALGFAHRPRSGLLVSRGFAFITTDVPHDVRLPQKTKKPFTAAPGRNPCFTKGRSMSKRPSSVASYGNGAKYTTDATNVNRCYEVFL